MLLSIDALSDTGCVREHNEDMILAQGELIRDERVQFQVETTDSVPVILAVADGMGGHNGGEFASELAVQSLDNFIHQLPGKLSYDELKARFDDWIQTIHREVLQKGTDLPEFLNMGTTLVGILVYENQLYWFNVGDSRLYRFRGGILSQISSDHSVKKMYNPSAPSNMICNSIGAGQEVFIDFTEMPAVFEDDQFLLCSDGLNDMIQDDKIEALFSTHVNAEQLVEAAKNAGGKDNVSVLLIDIKTIRPEVETPENEDDDLPEEKAIQTPLEFKQETRESTLEKQTNKPETESQSETRKVYFRKETQKPEKLFSKLGKLFGKEPQKTSSSSKNKKQE